MSPPLRAVAGVPDLRGISRTARRLKEAAGVITAIGVFYAGMVGAGAHAIKWMHLVTEKGLDEKTAPIVAAQQETSKQASAILAAVAKIQATADATAATVARLEKRRTKVSQPRRGADEQ